jgi:integrase
MSVVPVEIPKGSARWWIRIRWQFSQGKRWRKTKLIGVGDSAKDAAFERARILNEAWARFGSDAIKLVEPELPEKPKPITIAEYAPKFFARMKSSGLKRSTLAMYESNLKHHILPGLGDVELAGINYRSVADFLSSKATTTYSTGRFRVEAPSYNRKFKKPRPVPKEYDHPEAVEKAYSRDSLRIMVMTLRALMGEATKDQIIPVNPITGLSRFYRKRKKDREVRRSDVFTPVELHAIEDRLGERYPEYYEFSLAMSREGMRIGEAMALTIHDVDLERGMILINKNVPAGIGHLEDSTKTEPSDREIEFWSSDFRLALESMLKRRRMEWMTKGKPAPETLFCERSGHLVNYSRFVKAWNHAQRLAGVRQRSPHSLRHTWASHQISAGEDIVSVSKHLGHANPGVTLGIYTHFMPKRRRLIGTVLDRQKATERQVAEEL